MYFSKRYSDSIVKLQYVVFPTFQHLIFFIYLFLILHLPNDNKNIYYTPLHIFTYMMLLLYYRPSIEHRCHVKLWWVMSTYDVQMEEQ